MNKRIKELDERANELAGWGDHGKAACLRLQRDALIRKVEAEEDDPDDLMFTLKEAIRDATDIDGIGTGALRSALAAHGLVVTRGEPVNVGEAMIGKHTPTPWHIITDGPQANPRQVWRNGQDCFVCETGDMEGPPRGPADAAFIVRACNAYDDLLAALRDMVEAYRDECDDDDQPGSVRRAMAAISRATGG